MSEKEKIMKPHGKKMQRFNAKSCMSLFLCAVMLFTSIDYAQVQAEEATNKAAVAQEVSESTVKDENITENSDITNAETESANDAESGKGNYSDTDTGNETLPENADSPDTSNKESSGNDDGTDTSNEEPSENADGTDTGNKEDPETTDDTENVDNPANDDDSNKKDESDSNDDKNSEDSGSSSETEDTENPDGTNEDGDDEGDTPTENPDEPDKNDENKDKDDSPQEGENTGEIQFVKTAEGSIIISSFEQLQETDSKIVLDKKLPLDELTAMMPQTLKAYAYAYTTTENKADKASSSDTEPVAEIQKKLENAVAALTNSNSENETSASTNDSAEGETVASTNDNVEGETIAPTNDETNTDASGQTDEKETFLHELEIPVSWECSEDYNNTELESYDFTPSWDSAAYSYETTESADEETNEETDAETNEETSKETTVLPTITVIFDKNAKTDIVSTQEELEAAFASGISKIVLAGDISLTRTLTLPASADILLDGQGFSLTRGKDENGVFIDTMIYMGGDDYTNKDFGKLTLTDICIDGNTPNNRAGSSTIIDYGSLTLDKGAYIKNNSSYGIYDYDDNGKLQTLVDDFGGGVQVYGVLKVTEHSLITGNFADEFGGGVYLANESVLYLYADVIKENSVAKGTGYGADLYAASGSTIYYDSSIDMEREGFYICDGVKLICMDEEAETALFDEEKGNGETRNDEKVEIYISAADEIESGYSKDFLKDLADELHLEYGYSVIPKTAQIDTSDLRDWYVYDHYDTYYNTDTNEGCWGTEMVTDKSGNEVPKQWFEYKEYGDNPRRKYYPCTETHETFHTDNPVYTIAEWLDRTDYIYQGVKSLAQFKEHIYNPEGSTNMTFVGYGGRNNYGEDQAYIDFMFYDPQSNGEKVVNYDIDSSNVISHALAGTGFLINTGVENGSLYGYLIFYYYGSSSTAPGASPTNLLIYKLNGINIEEFHGGTWDIKNPSYREKMEEIKLDSELNSKFFDNWNNNMSIQIKASTTKIEVWQKPYDGTTDFSGDESRYIYANLEELGYYGFGPLVAYTGKYSGHSCSRASSFTYSDLRMYYTNPTKGTDDMLQPLELADFTQEGTQKYFLNLFGLSESQGYNNNNIETDLYQTYLKLMQVEGVALITDRNTPFEKYLGESGEAGSNLCEIINENKEKNPSVKELAAAIAAYIKKQSTTYLQHKLQSDEHDEGLVNATPQQAVGNIWLESASGHEQIRETLYGDSFIGEGFGINIIDDIAYYHAGRGDYDLKYEVIKPGGSTYTIETKKSDATVPSFVVGTNPSEWPAGRYTVKQTIISSSYGESTVHGYAYFDLKRNDDTGHTHTWSEWTTDAEPTCTTDGHRYRYCLSCNEKEEVTIPADGHKPNDEFDYDETDHWHTCSVCSEQLDMSPHEFGDWVVDKDKHRHECSICGYIIDEAEHDFDEWGYNATNHWRACSICGARTEAVKHEFGEWVSDKDYHWRECICGTRIDEAEHDFEKWYYNATSHWHECSCGVKTEAEIHEGEWITDKDATEDEEGSKYRICNICKYREDLIIPPVPHEHNFDNLRHNETSHWRECRCGEKTDEAIHNLGEWITDRLATEEADGLKHRECSVCEYIEQDVIKLGNVTKREDCGENAPRTVISTELRAVASVTLENEDIQKVKSGKDIDIILTVDDAGDTVSASDRTAITSVMGSYKLGQYLDVNLYKELNNNKSQITRTKNVLRLVLDVPETLKKANSRLPRSFVIIRVHDGNAVILNDLDSDDNTITIDTDRFSTYAIVYADKKSIKSSKPTYVSVDNNPDSNQLIDSFIEFITVSAPPVAAKKDAEPKTGNNSHIELYATIALIEGLLYLIYLFTFRYGFTEEKKDELIARLIGWAKQGGRLRRVIAIASIFMLLVYYHSIGKHLFIEWTQVYN